MADEAEVNAQVASLKQLLDSKLPAEDAVEFGASDLRLLVRKGYHTERRLRQATANRLQGPLGDAVQPFLVDILLTAFNPSALQPGRTNFCKAYGFSELRCQLAPSASKSVLSFSFNCMGKATPEVLHKASRRGNCRLSCESDYQLNLFRWRVC